MQSGYVTIARLFVVGVLFSLYGLDIKAFYLKISLIKLMIEPRVF